MNKSAHDLGGLFFKLYCNSKRCRVLDVGAMNVNGTLRDFCRKGMSYTGVDLEAGDGVDVVLENPCVLPFADNAFDAVVSTSTFEHAAHFWALFCEMARVTQQGGFIYINAPSNGHFHQYPYDFWRFYPDAGLALCDWAKANDLSLCLIESAIAAQDRDGWNDFFAVFQKSSAPDKPGKLIVDLYPGCTNIRRFDTNGVVNFSAETEDQRQLAALQTGRHDGGQTANPTLKQILRDHAGKTADTWQAYVDEYESLFLPWRKKPVRLLEIGVQNGGSLEIWAKYFRHAEKIIGCDIDPRCASLRFDDPCIAVVVGDANSDVCEKAIDEACRSYDIIIDDGSHKSNDIIGAFARYFPRLEDNGVYAIEDFCCSYWTDWQGGLHNPHSAISFFKRLVDIVNHEHWRLDRSRERHLEAFSQTRIARLDENALSSIHSITFANSLCIIRKRAPKANVLGPRIVAGKVAPVAPEVLPANGTSISDIQAIATADDDLDIFQLRERASATERELAAAQARLSDLERKARSSRWLARQLWGKVIHAPRDASRRLRRFWRKRRGAPAGAHAAPAPLASLTSAKRYRKYLSSRLILQFEPVLPRRFAARMRRRMEKHKPPAVAWHRRWFHAWEKRRFEKNVAAMQFPDLRPLERLEPKHKIAVVVHIYYAQLWEEIAAHLKHIEDGFDLFVSLVAGTSEELAPVIRKAYPEAQIFVFPNHGRDIFPFLTFLNTGVLDKYELVLKLHSKLTAHDIQTGKHWRQSLLDGLAGTPERVRGIITSFRADGQLGLVSPRAWVITQGNPAWKWDFNIEALQWLERRVGVPIDRNVAAFVAGTMFWARPQALWLLKGVLEAGDFDPEPLPSDGALQHAVERYIGIAAMGAGYRIAAVEALRFCGERTQGPVPKPRDVRSARWRVVRPLTITPGERVCLLAGYSADGKVEGYTKHYASCLRAQGLKVAYLVATDRADLAIEDPGAEVCDALIARENAGFDFASWALALKEWPELWSAGMLIFANDSVYGPFGDFAGIIRRIDEGAADFIGLCGSDELESTYHSFFFALKSAALQDAAVRRFWESVKILSTKWEVIASYELALLSRFSAAGLRCESLFHARQWRERRNATHFRWRELIEVGFPFIKIDLLRDNPEKRDLTGWDKLLREKGYDIRLIINHLRNVRPGAPALRAVSPVCTPEGAPVPLAEDMQRVA